MKKLVIAIDGPAGSGKSTAARLLAERLGLLYLDTGAMYRAATLACIRKGVNFDADDDIINCVRNCNIRLQYQEGKLEVYLDGREVTEDIRLPVVNKHISRVSEILEVRKLMVEKQRSIGSQGAVVEGRDITTVVFPDADFKFYLDADFDVRVDTGVANITKSLLESARFKSRVPLSTIFFLSASFLELSLLKNPQTSSANFLFFIARARDPPINPTPIIVIFRNILQISTHCPSYGFQFLHKFCKFIWKKRLFSIR